MGLKAMFFYSARENIITFSNRFRWVFWEACKLKEKSLVSTHVQMAEACIGFIHEVHLRFRNIIVPKHHVC